MGALVRLLQADKLCTTPDSMRVKNNNVVSNKRFAVIAVSPKPSQSGRLVSALGLFALMTVAHGQAPIAVNEEVLKSVMRDADSPEEEAPPSTGLQG